MAERRLWDDEAEGELTDTSPLEPATLSSSELSMSVPELSKSVATPLASTGSMALISLGFCSSPSPRLLELLEGARS